MGKTAIITPIYATQDNRRLDLFQRTLASVHKLSDNFSHITVDDGSSLSSGVQEICNRFAGDKRFSYLHRKRNNNDRFTASNAINAGINHVFSNPQYSDIDHLAFLHSDDEIISLEERTKPLSKNTGATIADMVLVTNRKEKLQRGQQVIPQEWIAQGRAAGIPYHTIIWQREFVSLMLNYNLNKGIEGLFLPALAFAEDRAAWKLTVLLSAKENLKIGYTPILSVKKHRQPYSVTGNTSYREWLLDTEVVEKTYYESKPLLQDRRLVRRLYILAGFHRNPAMHSLLAGFLR